MKYSRLFGFVTVLGVIFLYIFGVRLAKEYGLIIAYSTFDNILLLVPVIVGTLFLTVGICGVERQYFKNNRSLFTILTAISIPSFILIPFFYYWFSALEVGF